MEPILVPAPAKEAFKKLRPISDLIKAQVSHFKHLEEKLPQAVRRTLPQRAIVTEDDAARYIASITAYLRSQVVPPWEVRPQPTAIRIPAKTYPPVAVTPAPKNQLQKVDLSLARRFPLVRKSRNLVPHGRRSEGADCSTSSILVIASLSARGSRGCE